MGRFARRNKRGIEQCKIGSRRIGQCGDGFDLDVVEALDVLVLATGQHADELATHTQWPDKRGGNRRSHIGRCDRRMRSAQLDHQWVVLGQRKGDAGVGAGHDGERATVTADKQHGARRPEQLVEARDEPLLDSCATSVMTAISSTSAASASRCFRVLRVKRDSRARAPPGARPGRKQRQAAR